VNQPQVVAKFFRALERPAILCRHPFVRQFATGAMSAEAQRSLASRMRELADRSIRDVGLHVERHSFRRMEILRRCDMHREPHALVAKSLALSPRQFYRELHVARDLFTQYFLHHLALETTRVETTTDAFTQGFDRACALADAYAFDEAIAAANDLLRAGTDIQRRLALLEVIGRAHASAGREHDVDVVVREVHSLVVAHDGPAHALVNAHRIRARARFVNGKAEVARTLLRELPFPALRTEETDEERRAWALLFYDAAAYEELYGERDLAERCTTRANLLCASITTPDARLLARKQHLQGIRAMSMGDVEHALPLLNEAYALAAKTSLTSELLDVAQDRGAAFALAGYVQEGIEASHGALEWFEERNAPERGWYNITHAQLLFLAGEFRQGRAALDQIGTGTGDNARVVMQANGLAEYALRTGKLDEARMWSAHAIDGMRRHGAVVRLGYALIVDAEIGLRSNRGAESRENVDAAIEILGRSGTAAAYARALMVSARLTGNRQHARDAREIIRSSSKPSRLLDVYGQGLPRHRANTRACR